MHITIGLDPVLFSIGPLEVRWYSLAIIGAIFVGYALASREYRRRGLRAASFGRIALYAIVGGIAGARLLHIVDRLDHYLEHPAMVLNVASGGLAIYGAVIGGFVGVAIATRLEGIPLLPTIDAIAPGLALAQAVGRVGCIVNGDAWGEQTDWPVAFVYTNPDSYIPNRLLNVPTHPYPLYDMALNLVVFAIVWRLRTRPLPAGALFAIFVTLYAIGRFAISAVREERVWIMGLQEAQVIALGGAALGAVALVYLLGRASRAELQLR